MNNKFPALPRLTCARTVLLVVMFSTFIVAVLPNTKYLFGAIPLHGNPVHFLVFACLALLMDIAWPDTNFLVKLLLLCSFGLLIECVQYFLPYRLCSLKSVAFDAAGVICWFSLVKPVVISLNNQKSLRPDL